MIDHDEYVPPSPVLPLELAGAELERYFEIRMLRLFFDSSGERSVRWDEETGEVCPGVRYPRPGVYDFPATGPSGETSGT